MPSNSPSRTIGAAAATRDDVWFDSGADRCAAWLYRPAESAGDTPLVVMGHGLGAVREMRLDAFAERFAAAGMAVLVFDYRHLGASGGQPRQLIDIGRQLEDWRAALSFARALEGIDADRIAIWGSSFGGGHVLSIAARDHRVRAVVSNCPFTDGPASVAARIRAGALSSLVLAAAGVADVVGSLVGAAPILMPMAGTSRMPAFLASAGSISGASALVPPGTLVSARTSKALRRLPSVREQLSPNLVLSDSDAPSPIGRDSLWGVLRSRPEGFGAANAISARLIFGLMAYRPGKSLHKITAPTLICMCDDDKVAPAEATRRAARGLANIEVNTYPCDHFDIYVGTDFEHAVTDQIGFLHTHLALAAPAVK